MDIENKSSRFKEILVEKALLISAATSIVIVIFIFCFLFSQGAPAFYHIGVGQFLTGVVWQPTSVIEAKFGAVSLIWGTTMVTLLAMIIAVPLGIAMAIYIAEVAHPMEKEILKPIAELLAAVPSVVYGFFASTTMATWIQQSTGTPFRLNAMNGGMILAIMAIPTIVSLAEDAITSVPKDYREASLALGASKWETIRNAVLPSSVSGIIVSIFLGFGRAIGETMAVLMATGNAPNFSLNIFDSVRTLTATIAIETPEVAFGSLHWNALFALAIILFALTFFFNFLGSTIGRRLQKVGS
jgi:phosphate transport system permease protein